MRGVRCPGSSRGVPVSALVVLSLLTIGLSVSVPSPALPERNPPIPAADQAGHNILDTFRSMGGYFIENRGQVNGLVRYYSTGNPSVAFRDDGVVFVVSENREKGDMAGEWPHFPWQSAPAVGHVEPANSFAYLIRFDGANLVTPVGRDRLPFNSNFFIGKNSSGRIVDVPNYREVVYENLYDGIDLVYRPQGSAVKYEFTVDTMSDPGLIEVVYEGVKPLLEEGGGVVIKTVTGAVRDSRPFSYQAHGK